VTICKSVNSQLERVEFISTNKKDAEVERDELNAIMKRPDYIVVKTPVYVVVAKELWKGNASRYDDWTEGDRCR